MGCKKEGIYICEECINSVPKAREHCIVCNNYSYQFITHRSCINNTPKQSISVYSHKKIIRSAIHTLKYKFNYDIAGELISLVDENLNEYKIPQNIIVIPVPLSRAREKWRGFNQSYLLGRLLAKKRGWFVTDKALFKKDSKTQVGLNKTERLINIKDKFYLSQNFRANNDFTYLIFDDVTTTGATLLEATRVLKKSGVKKVICLTICS